MYLQCVFQSFLPINRLSLSLEKYFIIFFANLKYLEQVPNDPGNSEGSTDFGFAKLKLDSILTFSLFFLFFLSIWRVEELQTMQIFYGRTFLNENTNDWKYFHWQVCQKTVLHRHRKNLHNRFPCCPRQS